MIQSWLSNKHRDYETGVTLYANSLAVKTRILSQLRRGKNDRNMALLIGELRKVKTASSAPSPRPPREPQQKTVNRKPQTVEETHQRQDLIRKSTDTYFQKVRYAELPKELRPRYRLLKDLLYEMNEHKFLLNDLPAKKEKEALELIIKIDALDTQKELIWQEIDHWMTHKTLLPVKSADDFSKTPPHLLAVKKANLLSSISKISKRIQGWETKLETTEAVKEQRKILQQINRSKQKLHTHELNLVKIKELLHE